MMRQVRRAIRRGATWAGLEQVLVPPPRYEGSRLTLKRLLNFYLVRYQRTRGHGTMWGYPFVLTIEAANRCNLHCPYCFIGVGERSRPEAMFPLDLYARILDELGDYLMHVELYNWGEPLLNRHVDELVRRASVRGISTLIATNFSLPFDASRAEALVSSGLAMLGVSLDGAHQETYERYRVGGSFDTVVRNIRLVNEAKRRLGSRTPRVLWSYHVFAHNRADIARAGAMAAELGIELSVSKGWVEGPDWDPRNEFPYPFAPQPGQPAINCHFLWERAVVHVDGGVAPCDGTFFKEEDYGTLDGAGFKQVWNNEKFRAARHLFRSRAGGAATDSSFASTVPRRATARTIATTWPAAPTSHRSHPASA